MKQSVIDLMAASGVLTIGPSPEKQLISNLAEQANTIIAKQGFNDDVKDIVKAISILKQS